MSKQASLPRWLRLDNAAKIYPAARTRSWMPLFRVSITFKEEVDRPLLEKALQRTLGRIPLFSSRIRPGLFWYYMEAQDKPAPVVDDARNPMQPFNLTGSQDFMFRLRCHRKRVALEVYHALSDGTGAASFLLTLSAEYLRLRYQDKIPAGGLVLDIQQRPQPGEWEDAFFRVARDHAAGRGEKSAWQMKGDKNHKTPLRVITGVMPTAQLLALAREKNTTINTLLAALILQALQARKARSQRGRGKPIKLSLPVNLRRYYQANTLRNFSFYINVPLGPAYKNASLDGLIAYVGRYMALHSLEPELNARFSANVKAERNPLLRVAPLFVKTAVLKAMYKATGERYVTSTLSNLGNMVLPPAMEERVERMDMLLGPAKQTPLSCAVVSASGKTCLSFTSTIRQSDVEREVLTGLIKLGIPVLVESNQL